MRMGGRGEGGKGGGEGRYGVYSNSVDDREICIVFLIFILFNGGDRLKDDGPMG